MVQSANLTQSPVSGKYGRVLVSIDAATFYPVNLSKWSMRFETQEIDTVGFEDAGWENGVTGVTGATMELEGPYQINRAGVLSAPGMSILVPGRYFVYGLYIAHSDYHASSGDYRRYAGVGQVIAAPHDQECRGRSNIAITAKTRGPIYLPGVAMNFTPAQLLAYYGTGILSSDIPIASVLV